jgi:hypothetical protein
MRLLCIGRTAGRFIHTTKQTFNLQDRWQVHSHNEANVLTCQIPAQGMRLTPCHDTAGGLPDGWLSTSRVLRNVQYLDLSENFLGYSDAGKTPLATWCLAGTSNRAGWCPSSTPLSGTVSKLTTLDISDNGFAGEGHAF